MATDLKIAGEQNREQSRERSRAKSAAAQDIGEYPPCKNPAERARADDDFRYFVERYFAKQVHREWSPDHLRILEKLERTITERQCFAVAMPRGSGKTTLCQIATVWAILTGRHKYAFIICGTAQKATKVLNNIKALLRFNDLLYDDYPEAIHPIRVLNGESRRCIGQSYRGELTHIQWGQDKLGMAMIPGAVCSGALIHVSGITGDIRGALYGRPDGEQVRPTLALIDDPQTDESAKSPIQTADRLEIIHGAIAGLAGPGEQTAILITCTVIAPNDLAEQLLDRVKFPQWRGEKTVAVTSWPDNMDLWDQYKELWNAERLAEGDGSQANAFYLSHRVAMDAGFEVAWEARKDDKDISAQQHMMHLLFDRGTSFYAEMQNEPKPQYQSVDRLDPRELSQRCIGIKRCVVPEWASRVTAFVDVQEEVLYYAIAAWGEDFRGCVIDYGTYPDQRVPYFLHTSVRRTLAKELPGAGLEGSIRDGLDRLALHLLGRDWMREDGVTLRVERCLIDANFKPDVVYEFCKRSAFSTVVMPRWGDSKKGPKWEPALKPGDRAGFRWIVRRSSGRTIPHVFVDVNGWKSFVAQRLKTPIGDKGAIVFFGRDPNEHRMFIDHLTAEEMHRKVSDDGAVTDAWTIKPEAQGQNHWWDCLVGAAVAASVQGVQFEAVTAKPMPRKRVSFAEMQREAFQRQGIR